MSAQWITIEQASQIAGCHASSIRRYVRAGMVRKWQAIPSNGKRRGSKPRFHAGDVQRLVRPGRKEQ